MDRSRQNFCFRVRCHSAGERHEPTHLIDPRLHHAARANRHTLEERHVQVGAHVQVRAAQSRTGGPVSLFPCLTGVVHSNNLSPYSSAPAGLISEGGDDLSVAHHISVGSKAVWDEIEDAGKQHPDAFKAE